MDGVFFSLIVVFCTWMDILLGKEGLMHDSAEFACLNHSTCTICSVFSSIDVTICLLPQGCSHTQLNQECCFGFYLAIAFVPQPLFCYLRGVLRTCYGITSTPGWSHTGANCGWVKISNKAGQENRGEAPVCAIFLQNERKRAPWRLKMLTARTSAAC